MALNKTDLQTSIKLLMTEMLTREENSIDEFSSKLAQAMDEYIRSAEIIYQTGLIAPTGPVTGVFKGNLK